MFQKSSFIYIIYHHSVGNQHKSVLYINRFVSSFNHCNDNSIIYCAHTHTHTHTHRRTYGQTHTHTDRERDRERQTNVRTDRHLIVYFSFTLRPTCAKIDFFFRRNRYTFMGGYSVNIVFVYLPKFAPPRCRFLPFRIDLFTEE